MTHLGNNRQKLPRATLRNFGQQLKRGDWLTIAKVLRRRFLNFLKIIRRLLLPFLNLYFENPIVKHRQLMSLLRRHYDWGAFSHSDAKLKVALIIRDGTTHPSSSAFIRLLSPLTDRSMRGKANLRIFPQNTIDVGSVDVCIVQRNAFDTEALAKKLVVELKKNGTALVIDTDDAFHVIDADHPEHQQHRDRLAAFDYLLSKADQVWLSTKRLQKSLGKLGGPTIEVCNSLDKRLWHPTRVSNHPEALQLLYMGTVSHDSDFQIIYPALKKLAKRFPGQFKLTLIGAVENVPNDDWVERLYARRGGSLYLRFVPWLLKQGPYDIGLSPLVDSQFNNGKSDIKCLDYLATGILPVVSDVEPYRNGELAPYIIKVKNSPTAWETALADLIVERQALRAELPTLINQAQKYLWTKRSSAVTAQQLHRQLVELAKS